MKVLAVEDDKIGKFLYEALAKRYKFDVIVVDCCNAALAACRMLQFDVILMDWQLAGVNGLECTKLFRAQHKELGRYVPIIAVTANAMEGHRETCLAAGMDDYLAKPFRADELYALLQKWTNRPVIQFPKEECG